MPVPVPDNALKFRLRRLGISTGFTPRTSFERWKIAYSIPDTDSLLEQLLKLRLEFFVNVGGAGQMSHVLGSTRQEKSAAPELRDAEVRGVEDSRLDIVPEFVETTCYLPAHSTFIRSEDFTDILDQDKLRLELLDEVKEHSH
jgi:hypothetical protein